MGAHRALLLRLPFGVRVVTVTVSLPTFIGDALLEMFAPRERVRAEMGDL
ncbi:hypothetical protein [Burkholderia ubonensis]|nr:hypothetical protein [Burkholderia ubonensis]